MTAKIFKINKLHEVEALRKFTDRVDRERKRLEDEERFDESDSPESSGDPVKDIIHEISMEILGLNKDKDIMYDELDDISAERESVKIQIESLKEQLKEIREREIEVKQKIIENEQQRQKRIKDLNDAQKVARSLMLPESA